MNNECIQWNSSAESIISLIHTQFHHDQGNKQKDRNTQRVGLVLLLVLSRIAFLQIFCILLMYLHAHEWVVYMHARIHTV